MSASASEWPRQALLVFYVEIGQHLRAGGDLRDRLATLYMTMLAAAASGFAVLQSTQSSAVLRNAAAPAAALSIALAVFGELVLWGVVASRIWHAEYVNCMILLQAMMRVDTLLPTPEVVDVDVRYSYMPGVTTSRMYVIVQGGVIFTVFAAAKLAGEWFLPYCSPYLIAGLLSGMLLLINAVLTRRTLMRAEVVFWKDPTVSWCLAGLRPHLARSAEVSHE